MIDKMVYRFRTRVVKVEEKKQTASARKTGKLGGDGKEEIETVVKSLGWFVQFEDSWESIRFGEEKPALEKGQEVVVSIEVVS